LLSHLHTITLVGLAVLVALLAEKLSVPVPWLIGPMIVGVAAAVRNRRPVDVPHQFYLVGTVILGLASSVGFPPSTLLALGQYAVPLIGLVLVTVSLSMLNGYLLARWTGLDIATALMGSLPGAASTMVIMSTSVGANALMVAVLQYLRLLIVILIMPPATSTLFPTDAISGVAPSLAAIPIAPPFLNLALITMAGITGAVVGQLVRLPAPQFLGPLLAMLALSWSLPFRLEVPHPLFAGGMVLLGLVIAGRFDVAEARTMGRVSLVNTGLVLGLISISLGLGYLFSLLTGISPITATLGAAPGGMEVMVATAPQLGADPGLVLAMQLTRWFAILIAGPWVASRLLVTIRRKQDSV
jgi:uncharacterized protein